MAEILHVNDYREAGGAEILTGRLIELQRARGMDAQLFTIEQVTGFARTPSGYIDSLRCRRAFREALRMHAPRVVHLHNFYHVLSPGILAVLAKLHPRPRIVMTAHDFHLACPNSGMRWFRGDDWRLVDPARLARLSYLLTKRWDHRGWGYSTLKLAQHLWNYRILARHRVIDTVMTASRFGQQVLASLGLPAVVVPIPAPPGCPPPGKPSGPLRMISVGRVEPEKGIVDLLRGIPASFPGTLTVVGGGASLAACREIVQQRGLGAIVQFTGPLPHEQAMQLIAEAHLLVLPSLVYESAGLVLLEALAQGTSILTSHQGGPGEIVHDSGVGYTFPAGDQRGFDAALNEVLAAHAAGTLNQFDASKFLDDHSEQRYVDRVGAVYRAVRDAAT